jgi:signal transduction histidine kinase
LRPSQIPLVDVDRNWRIGDVLRSGAPQLMQLESAAPPIAAPLWPDPVSRALALPTPPGATTCMAVLVMGVSPRRPFDDGYQGFFDLVARQFAAAISDAQAYESERARAEALAEIDRAKTAFFSNVSHEFRTPLTLLLGPLEDALQNPAEGLQGESLGSAHRNALRLLRLVNTLLDFSRIESGRAQAHYVPADLAPITQELASVFQSAMARAGLRYLIRCEPLPEPVFVDHEMWEKIVLNLLSNAFKYTFDGEIRVELMATDGGAQLIVADTGTGIPADALPQLFNRFYRVPGASGRTHEGSGIGLSLVRELVKQHGGSIEVDSIMGQGSVFRVNIPFGPAQLPRAQVTDGAAHTMAASNARA